MIHLQHKIYKMLHKIRNSGKLTLQVFGLSAISFLALAVFLAIFGEAGEMFIIINPVTSGFIHAGFEHLFYNLLLIFIFTLPELNSKYDINKLFWITFILSCAYLPISLLEYTRYSVGISGTCFFLMSRFFFSKDGPILLRILKISVFSLTILGEILGMNKAEDGIAHGVHLLGVLLGIITIYINPKYIPELIRRFVI